MFNYLFPKVDISNKEIGSLLSDYKKSKFLVHDEVCYICNRHSSTFKTHSFCDKNIKQLVTCFYYTKDLKKYILAFKYYHRKEIIADFSYLMSIFYKIYFSNLDPNKTVLTFIPMHWFRKYFIKGYNQWELLAKYLWDYLNLKVAKIWKKIKYTKPQAKIRKRNNRLVNVKDSFIVDLTNFKNIENIVIVDDIITTGSTLKEFASSIRKVNNKINIFGIVLARK